jgi:hypothetical protein
VEPLKKLYARWSDQVHFIDIVVRQAHPGPGWEPYHTMDEKLRDARRYQDEDGVPWTILADDLEGTVHQVYGGMADPSYLIDVDGRVAFYNMWTYAPTLYTAIETLLAQGGRGVVDGGYDQVPHMTPALTDGWRGLKKGLPQSYLDMETAAPGAATGTLVGYLMRPLLAPITLRPKPMSPAMKVGLALGGIAIVALGARGLRRRGA